jgi:hypothetical protein
MKSNLACFISWIKHTALHKKTLAIKNLQVILDLVDYERPPSVSMDTKRNTCCSRIEILIKL